MKKKIFSLAVVAFLIGCGSSDNDSTSTNNASSNSSLKQVQVIDSYVIGAQVCDKNGICATTEKNGIAEANFGDTILTSKAGYIDINNNGKIDSDDLTLPDDFTLQAPKGFSVITPLTDLVVNGADSKKLSLILNKDLTIDPIKTNDIQIAKIFQIIYAVKIAKKEKEFISYINNNKLQNLNNILTTDLPSFENIPNNSKSKTTDITTPSNLPSFERVSNNKNIENNSNNEPVNSNLPFAYKSDLPSFENISVNKSSNVSNDPVILFANIAKKVISDSNIRNFIDKVISLKVNNAVEIEKSLIEDKKSLEKTPITVVSNENTSSSTDEMSSTTTKNKEIKNTPEKEVTSITNSKSALPSF